MFYAVSKHGFTGAFKRLRDIPADAKRITAKEARYFEVVNLSRAVADTQNRWARFADRWIGFRFRRLRYDNEGVCVQAVRIPLATRLAEFKRKRFRDALVAMAGDAHPVVVHVDTTTSMGVITKWRERSKYQARHGMSNGQEVYLRITALPEDFAKAVIDPKNKTVRVGNKIAWITGRARGDWRIEEVTEAPLVAAIRDVLAAKAAAQAIGR